MTLRKMLADMCKKSAFVAYILSYLIYDYLISGAQAYIAPLNGACAPYLCDGSHTYVVDWGRGSAAARLYNSDIIDISREGVRYISQSASVSSSYYSLARSQCTPTQDALCVMQDGAGEIFPNTPPNICHDDAHDTSSNELSRLIARDSDCLLANTGVGRVYSFGKTTDVSLCNVQKGKYSVVYDTVAQQVALHRRTFGPMAYTLVLILCAVNITGIACVNMTLYERQSACTLYLVDAISSVCIAVIFACSDQQPWATSSDLAYLLFTMFACVIYCACGLVICVSPPGTQYGIGDARSKISIQQGACWHAVDTMGVLIYHTPETPYSWLLLIMVAAKTWARLFRCADQSESVSWLLVLDAVLCGSHLALVAQLGVSPQLELSDTWPAIMATVLYCSHVWVYCGCNVIVADAA